jgi:hypothetical protein
VAETSASGYVVPSTTAVVDDGPAEPARVYVARLPAGPLLVLEGTAALIWRAVQSDCDVTTTVARQTGAQPTDIRSDVDSVLRELVRQGVLGVAPGR